MRKVGIFGGTFDPPHFGHLTIAEKAIGSLGLDELIWMVTPDPPHKQGRIITEFRYRFQMVQICVMDHPNFTVSDLESRRDGPHYTFDTLNILNNANPDTELVLLIGGDSLRDLHTWHQPEKILKLVTNLGVFARGEIDVELGIFAKNFPSFIDKVSVIPADPIAISSSQIRELLGKGLDVGAYLPEELIGYIKETGLYPPQDVTMAEA